MSAESSSNSFSRSVHDIPPDVSDDSGSGDAESLLSVRSKPAQLQDSALLTLATDSPLASLPFQLDVTVPIPSFRVQDLLALEKGSVLETSWSHAEDVPVWCGGVQLAWTEFEVVDQKLAVRITRIV